MKENSLLYSYQHLPSLIDPVFFRIGNFSLRWYGIMYLVAFFTIYIILRLRLKNSELKYDRGLVLDFLIVVMAGSLLGGRLGFVLFYNLPYYLQNHWEILLPIKFTQNGMFLTGFYGMSFYGGLLGATLIALIWTRKKKIDFWCWTDFVLVAVPAGYFFGRIGNFLNGELFGRETTGWWGMYFPNGQGILRHPSQLYEAFFEGLIIFAILWLASGRKMSKGSLTLLYLGLYGLFRFWLEFVRQPDPQLGFVFSFLTLGQIFSAIMITVVMGAYFYLKNKYEEKD